MNKYKVILADPPWNFRAFSDRGDGRGAKAHYDCMSLEDIFGLRSQIDDLAAEDCVLLLWTTDPHLPQAFRVIEEWGFTYKTVGFYWAKLNKSANRNWFCVSDFFTGMGYWTRANIEPCLLATRGSPQRLNMDVRRLLISCVREHSRKPDELYPRIERLLEGPYFEMFSRQSRPGWDCHGDEAGLFDQGPVQTRRLASTLSGLGR